MTSNIKIKIIVLLAFLCLNPFQIYPQEKNYTIKYFSNSKEIGYKVKSQLNRTERKIDSSKISQIQLNKILNLNHLGYLEANIDSFRISKLLVKSYINPGPKYTFGKFNLPHEINFIKTQQLEGKTYNNKTVIKISNEILNFYENNGYPFIQVIIDSSKIDTSKPSIGHSIYLNKNDLIHYNSFIFDNNTKIQPYYLSNYLGIKLGAGYKEKSVSKIDARLNNLEFIRTQKPTEIEFNNTQADIILFIKNQKANQFSGIIGFANNEENTSKFNLTGDIDLRLINMIDKGEHLDINWKKKDEYSQKLNVYTQFPYVFKTQFGIDFNYQGNKKDTSYLNTKINPGIQILNPGGNYFKIYYEYKTSTILSEELKINQNYNGYTINIGGATIYYSSLDYKYNPQNGCEALINYGVGQKKNKNRQIGQKADNYFETNWDLKSFIKIFPKNVFHTNVLGGIINQKTEHKFSENEMFLIGGFKTLRGFDEEKIAASSYILFKFEYRILYSKNSNVFVFFDQGYYSIKKSISDVHDKPYGFGIGTNFETKAGVFSMAYSLGKQFNNPILLKNAKIHFGFSSRF